MFEQLQTWFVAHIDSAFHILVLGVGGFWLTRILGRLLDRRLKPHLGPQASGLLAKSVKYLLNLLIVATLLRELGFNLTAILGAAGVAGVALGFAAQTSLSNLISGLFLVWERPFRLGDTIEVDGITGVVHSVDLLSASIRTFDNRVVRIPNESLVKGRVTNLTRMPIRRVDLSIRVACQSDANQVMRLLTEIADRHPRCLDEPRPVVILRNLDGACLDFLLGVWVVAGDMTAVQNEMLCAIQARFAQEGIAFPPPATTVVGQAQPAPN